MEKEEKTELDIIIEEMLSKEYFIPSDEDMTAMWNKYFEYPNFNDKSLKDLLFKIATTENAKIMEGKHTQYGYEIEWYVVFYTSPSQVATLHQRRFYDYPHLVFEYEAKKKNNGYESTTVGGWKITLGQCRSLIKHYNPKWV